jgi:hypothetical protein
MSGHSTSTSSQGAQPRPMPVAIHHHLPQASGVVVGPPVCTRLKAGAAHDRLQVQVGSTGLLYDRVEWCCV